MIYDIYTHIHIKYIKKKTKKSYNAIRNRVTDSYQIDNCTNDKHQLVKMFFRCQSSRNKNKQKIVFLEPAVTHEESVTTVRIKRYK